MKVADYAAENDAMLSPTQGLVVVMEGSVDQRLRSVAEEHGFPVLVMPRAIDAFRTILRLDPLLIVVQITQVADEAVNLIRIVANAGRSAALIAVNPSQEEKVERAARHAGAAIYVSGTGSDLLDQVITAAESPRW